MQQRGADFGRGFAGDSRDDASPVNSGHAGVHPQRSQDAAIEVLENGKVVSWTLYHTRQAQKDAKNLLGESARQSRGTPGNIGK
jgi:hypothetical protein